MRIPQQPPRLTMEAALAAEGRYMEAADKRGRYRHWDTLRRIKPPEGLTTEQWWASIQLARQILMKPLPLRTRKGTAFRFAMPDPAWEMLHHIDQQAAGRIGAVERVASPHLRSRYIISSLIEEAITSSQLEGASTTRIIAKEMIRSGRKPRDRHERMILNNFHGMEYVREHLKTPLTSEVVFELHRVLTEDTLDHPDAAGRVQRPDEKRVGVYDPEGNLLHEPPPAEQLPERMEQLCAFANGDIGPDGFLHPVARSILVHFWLAHDHPFEDGNGRTARALFYWSMLRQGYWLAEFLSISRILRRAPAQYGKSFLYVETDEGDTTYFILNQLRVICRAIDELHDYLQRKEQEVSEVEAAIRRSETYNRRQLALLGHAVRHPGARYTFRSHALSHGVTHEAARKDLQDLTRRGLLKRGKVGREYTFEPMADLARLLQSR